MIVGKLFGGVRIDQQESNSGIGKSSTIGLLLGVSAKDVKTEHRAALITFSQWTLMDIVEEDQVDKVEIMEMGDNDLSFSRRLFNESMKILKLDNL